VSTLEGVDVRRLRLKAGDTIVLTPRIRITRQQAADLRASAQRQWPNHDVVVLDGLDITVVEPLDTPPTE
jgi:gentisate 1,2-dioxygenase